MKMLHFFFLLFREQEYRRPNMEGGRRGSFPTPNKWRGGGVSELQLLTAASTPPDFRWRMIRCK